MSNQKLKLDVSFKKVAEGLLHEVGTETAEQSQASPARRMVGIGHFTDKIPSTGTTAHDCVRIEENIALERQ
jgi:hypothetical protein